MQRNLFLILTILFISCKEEKKNSVSEAPVTFTKEATAQIYKGDSVLVDHLDIEIAESPYERQTGLMYRTSMEEKQGMWFVFEEEAPRAFYMKNTLFALDIIYADKNRKVVSIVKNATPVNEASLPSEKPAMYVLELLGGTTDSWNITVGDSIAVDRLQ